MLAANPPPMGEGDHAQHGGGGSRKDTDPEAGMAAMSELFKEEGGELYLTVDTQKL
jgi:phosphomethylpyrimidine synthase